MDRIHTDYPSAKIQKIEKVGLMDDVERGGGDNYLCNNVSSSHENINILPSSDRRNDGRGDQPLLPSKKSSKKKKVKQGSKPDQPLSIIERRLGKTLSTSENQDIFKIGLSLETAKIVDGHVLYKKPEIVRMGGSLDDVRIPVVKIEEDVMELPIVVAPKTRRVSDVIDSVGSSTPSTPSPRNPMFLDPNKMKSVNAFVPDWLDSSDRKVADRTDSAPMGQDDFDAKPITDEDDDDEEKQVYASMPVEKHSDEYNMNHRRRGHAIVFNHDTFDNGFGDRPGSDIDAKALKETFTALDFQVTIHHNLEFAKIKNYIEILKKEDHSDADCLVIVILSHGIQGGYILSKDVPYSVDFLWHSFKADVCPSLAGKPKMFFIQACRGEKLDKGVHMMRSPGRTQTDSAASEYKIPTFADFLIAFSTVDGHYAWRNPENGTWFIQCLCKELMENGTTIDVLKIMTRTARRVALDHESFDDVVPWNSEMKQVPSINSMLIRDIYFRPKKGKRKTTTNSDQNDIKQESNDVEMDGVEQNGMET